MTTYSSEQVRLRPLTLVEDTTDQVLVGDPETATFITVPPAGAVVIRALQRGASMKEAALEAEASAGEPVDVRTFVEALHELGFVKGDDEELTETTTGPKVQRTAPIQQRRWVSTLDPSWARPFFSPVAWTLYTAALLFSIGSLILRPELFPRPEDTFVFENRGLALLILVPLSYLQTALHEAWHWLGARAAGVSARFGVDRRLCFLVFETDLSQLWSLPRRQRYAAQLAGMAIDSLLLAILLAVQLVGESSSLPLPRLVTDLAAAMAFVTLTGIAWQSMIFMRTDLYGVLVTATGCNNLWEVKSLLLKRAMGRRLSLEQHKQLAQAHPRDVAVGRWFRWIYLLGIPLALAYYSAFHLPILIGALSWTAEGLSGEPNRGRFWLTFGESLAIYLPLLLVLITSVKARLDRNSLHRGRV
ncbi:hypothetical protein EES45_36190 [Streptomyces sp. ADI97-07]|uniref:hypothetical protein n=1 Tax=Streptomyces sp. ADI97-07 TaxID=1522762 RepID=UPI000F55170B|nr:hypothetical protein [Streptomyces sp. ADI97-07]RPK69962.1 hypothetical protein EES45_36190 [Streptomyces sp. ADI97-07]